MLIAGAADSTPAPVRYWEREWAAAADSAIGPFDSNQSANSATTYLFFHWPYY